MRATTITSKGTPGKEAGTPSSLLYLNLQNASLKHGWSASTAHNSSISTRFEPVGHHGHAERLREQHRGQPARSPPAAHPVPAAPQRPRPKRSFGVPRRSQRPQWTATLHRVTIPAATTPRRRAGGRRRPTARAASALPAQATPAVHSRHQQQRDEHGRGEEVCRSRTPEAAPVNTQHCIALHGHAG